MNEIFLYEYSPCPCCWSKIKYRKNCFIFRLFFNGLFFFYLVEICFGVLFNLFGVLGVAGVVGVIGLVNFFGLANLLGELLTGSVVL